MTSNAYLARLSWHDSLKIEQTYRFLGKPDSEEALRRAHERVPEYMSAFLKDVLLSGVAEPAGQKKTPIYTVQVIFEQTLAEILEHLQQQSDNLASTLHVFLKLQTSQEAQMVSEQLPTLYFAPQADPKQLRQTIREGIRTFPQLVRETIKRYPRVCHNAMGADGWAKLLKTLPAQRRQALLRTLGQLEGVETATTQTSRTGRKRTGGGPERFTAT